MGLCNTNFNTMFITRVNFKNLYFILKCMWNLHMKNIQYSYVQNVGPPIITCLWLLMKNSITWIRIFSKSKYESTPMGLGGLFRLALMQYCTWGGGPTMEGSSPIGILGFHHRFGCLLCGLCASASSSIGLGIGSGVSSANPSFHTICSCRMLCIGLFHLMRLLCFDLTPMP